MKSQLRGLMALAAILMVFWPVEPVPAAGRYDVVKPDESQSVPTHSTYGLRIAPRLDYSLRDLQFVTPLVGYAMGTGLRRGQAPVVYKTRDGGKSWLVRPIECGWNPRAIAFADEKRGLVTVSAPIGCPDACQYLTAALLTSDGGETWSEVRYLEFQGAIVDVIFNHEGTAFGMLFHMMHPGGDSWPEYHLTLLRSDDVGRSWSRIHELPRPGFDGFGRFPLRYHQDRLYIPWADASIKVFDTDGRLLETVETGYYMLWDLVIVSESTIFATAINLDGTQHLIRTVDAGRTWEIVYEGAAKVAFARSSDDFGIIVNRGHMGYHQRSLDVIAHTTDGGTTWRESEPVLSLGSNIRRRVHHPSVERDLLLLGSRVVEIDHFDRE